MKKRILSLILALSMVLSVFPLGAFAADPPELVMENGYPVGSNGNGWSYDNNTQTLTLTSGPFDFSSTHPQNTGAGTRPVPAVRCMIEIRSGVEITGGSFGNSVTNYGTISSGTFQTMGGGVINEGTIKNGTFTDSVTNNKTISGGTFQNGCSVTNGGTISDGTFQNRCIVTNKSIISGGTFQNGCSVTNNKTISGGTFQNGCRVTNYGTINGKGTFEGTVVNSGTIENGIFNGTVENFVGTISGGTFKGTVNNDYGTISGGTFAAGLSKNNGSKILGGIFNGNANLTGAYHVTVTDGSVSQVNGEGPLNVDGTTGTAWDLYSYKDTTMTITADTDIFSLNGKPIGDGNCNSSYGSDRTTVTFTMPGENVVLNGAITCTDLVMKKGYPEDSNGGTTPCEGTGWTYSKKDASNPKGKLTLTDGTYDFSYTYPQNSNGAGAEPVACAVELNCV